MKHKARLKGISRCIRRVHLINAFQTGKSNRIGCAFYCDDHVHFHTFIHSSKQFMNRFIYFNPCLQVTRKSVCNSHGQQA